MGYCLTFEKSHDDVAVGCAFNNFQMNYVRLMMIEAGATAGDGFAAAIGGSGLEVCADTVPVHKFMSNGGWHITAHEAAFVAARLRKAVSLGLVSELLMFFDECPDGDDVQDWVEEFAAFNEQAAKRDGYYVN